MDIKNYFDPISKITPSTFFKSTEGLLIHDIEKNNIENCQVALIGITETRNSFQKAEQTNLHNIRSYLYSLASLKRVKVADLGNLKLGKGVKDTYASVEYITKYLIDKKIIPIYFGGSQDTLVPIFKGVQGDFPECVIIDNRIDLGSDEFHSKNYIGKLTENESADISVAGVQAYFVPKQQLEQIKQHQVSVFRLGQIRDNFSFIEPILRDADTVSIDLSSIRQSEFPSSFYPSPNGFYNEEVCQLANLSGLSDRAKVFAISDYDSTNDHTLQSSKSAAEIIWHFINGISQRKLDYPACELDDYKKIYVKIGKTDTELVFYQNPQNNRFWVQIPTTDDKNKIISCSEQDYKLICANDMPDRIWKKISKYFS